MVRLIMGANGAGKTKQLIELIHNSVESETGSVVCIEPSRDMTYDISYNVRLVNAGEYNVDSFECLRGFLCGLYAGNYDISHVFVPTRTWPPRACASTSEPERKKERRRAASFFFAFTAAGTAPAGRGASPHRPAAHGGRPAPDRAVPPGGTAAP